MDTGSIVGPTTNFLVGFLDDLEKEGELSPNLVKSFDYANNNTI